MAILPGVTAGQEGYRSFREDPPGPPFSFPMNSYPTDYGDVYPLENSPPQATGLIPYSWPAPSVFAGVQATSCQRFYLYDTIHLNPNEHNLGAIGTDVIATTYLWNAFLSDTVLNAVLEVDSEGVSSTFYVGDSVIPTPLPFPLAALQVGSWVFRVEVEVGPAVLDAYQTLDTSNGNYTVHLTGERSQLWFFSHNWVQPYMETIEWKTAIQVSYNGREHRTALRKIPRVAGEMQTYLKNSLVRKFQHLTTTKQATWLTAPLPQYITLLAASATIGSNTLSVNSVLHRGLEVGGALMLLDPLTGAAESTSISLLQHNEPGPDLVVLTTNLTKSWPNRTLVFPAAPAKVRGSLPITWLTNEFATGGAVLDWQPTFSYLGLSYPTYEEGGPFFDSYENYEIFTTEPDWAGGISKDYGFERGEIDSQTGVVDIYKTKERQQISTVFPWLLRDYEAASKFRAFLGRRLGMAIPFWRPSWVSDLKSIPYSYSQAEVELFVNDEGFFNYAYNKENRKHLQLELNNGRVLRARIISCEPLLGGQVKLELSEPLPWDFESTSIRRISFLYLCRLATDSVTMEWLSPGVAKVSLDIVTVPEPLQYEGEV